MLPARLYHGSKNIEALLREGPARHPVNTLAYGRGVAVRWGRRIWTRLVHATYLRLPDAERQRVDRALGWHGRRPLGATALSRRVALFFAAGRDLAMVYTRPTYSNWDLRTGLVEVDPARLDYLWWFPDVVQDDDSAVVFVLPRDPRGYDSAALSEVPLAATGLPAGRS